jgi:Ni,Fe-hydrogenase III component G
MVLLLESKRARKQALEAANEIAKENGGANFMIENAQELETALGRIQVMLRNSYAVTYRASGQAAKGKSIEVKIEVYRKGVEVVAARRRVVGVR